MMKRQIAAACTALFLLLAQGASAHGFKIGALEIGHPYSRAMLPGAKVGGGYFKIVNTGDTADRLVSVTSDRSPDVQIHEMKMDGAIMEMRPLPDGLAVPAHETVELKPASYHVMFTNVTQPFKEGEMIKATLNFEKAGPVEVEFVVGPAGGDKAGDKAGGHDAHKDHGK
jgi:periplasmic copper chaperone A